MPPNEHSPLLENGRTENTPRRSFGGRVIAVVRGEGEPGFIQSYRHLFLGSWINILLIFIILSGVSHYLKWDAGLRFVFSFLAIIPLAKVCSGRSSPECVWHYLSANRRIYGWDVFQAWTDRFWSLERFIRECGMVLHHYLSVAFRFLPCSGWNNCRHSCSFAKWLFHNHVSFSTHETATDQLRIVQTSVSFFFLEPLEDDM